MRAIVIGVGLVLLGSYPTWAQSSPPGNPFYSGANKAWRVPLLPLQHDVSDNGE